MGDDHYDRKSLRWTLMGDAQALRCLREDDPSAIVMTCQSWASSAFTRPKHPGTGARQLHLPADMVAVVRTGGGCGEAEGSPHSIVSKHGADSCRLSPFSGIDGKPARAPPRGAGGARMTIFLWLPSHPDWWETLSKLTNLGTLITRSYGATDSLHSASIGAISAHTHVFVSQP